MQDIILWVLTISFGVSMLLLIVSVILNVALYYFLRKSLNQNDIFESSIIDTENWMSDVQETMLSTYLQLTEIDAAGSFSSDDEVGFVFKDILNIIAKCNTHINEYNGTHITLRKHFNKHNMQVFDIEDPEKLKQYIDSERPS